MKAKLRAFQAVATSYCGNCSSSFKKAISTSKPSSPRFEVYEGRISASQQMWIVDPIFISSVLVGLTLRLERIVPAKALEPIVSDASTVAWQVFECVKPLKVVDRYLCHSLGFGEA